METIRPLSNVKPFYNFLMGWNEGIPKKWYCGIEGITFIWHGEWSDPEIGYKGYAFNEPTFVDGLYDVFYEETGKDNHDEFIEWLKNNSYMLTERLDEVIDNYRHEITRKVIV